MCVLSHGYPYFQWLPKCQEDQGSTETVTQVALKHHHFTPRLNGNEKRPHAPGPVNLVTVKECVKIVHIRK